MNLINKSFITFVNNEMYIANEKDYRKLSKKEVLNISKDSLKEIELNKFVFEDIENIEVYPIIQFPKSVKKILKNSYPKDLTKKQKKDIVKIFRGVYFLKLMNYLGKNQNLSFTEVNKLTLEGMIKEKGEFKKEIFNFMRKEDLNIIQEELENHFRQLLSWYEILKVGRSIRLTEEYGNIVFKKVSELYVDEEERKNNFFKNIKKEK